MLFHGCAQMFVKCGFSFHQSMAWRASSNPTCKVSSSRPRQHPFTHRGPLGAHHARSGGAYHARSLGALLPQFREEGPARGNLCLAVVTWALIGPPAGRSERGQSQEPSPVGRVLRRARHCLLHHGASQTPPETSLSPTCIMRAGLSRGGGRRGERACSKVSDCPGFGIPKSGFKFGNNVTSPALSHQ